MDNFIKERDGAFKEAVLYDKWEKVKEYAKKKYGVPFPKSKKAMKVGVYKAVQYCTDIPDDVKEIAIEKCLKLGFNPFIDWRWEQ